MLIKIYEGVVINAKAIVGVIPRVDSVPALYEEAIKDPELPAVYKKYTTMMKEFIDKDIEDALLGDEEESEEEY